MDPDLKKALSRARQKARRIIGTKYQTQETKGKEAENPNVITYPGQTLKAQATPKKIHRDFDQNHR